MSRHNDYDYRCIRWYGDRSPARNRKLFGEMKSVKERYKWFGGDIMTLNDHRCIVCNPFSDQESDQLLGY